MSTNVQTTVTKSTHYSRKEWLQYFLSNGYYIDLMLSVDSHYLNDPLPNIVFLRKKGREYWEVVAWRLNIDSYQNPNRPRLWSNDTVTDLNSMHRLSNFFLEEGITHILEMI
jgi:hexosaminidase